jgi:hypothetical protein
VEGHASGPSCPPRVGQSSVGCLRQLVRGTLQRGVCSAAGRT